MRVLWFSPTPCGSIRRTHDHVTVGGWLISLEDQIRLLPEMYLSVAYFSEKTEPPFDFDGVKYYPICGNILNANNGINRIRERFLSQKRKDDKVLPLMLDVVSQSQPDIIHIHGTEGAFGLIAEHITNIPIVFSIQGMIAPYKEMYFAGIPQSIAYKYDSLTDQVQGVGIRNQYISFCYRAEREKVFLSNAQYIFGRTFWDAYCTVALNPIRKYYTVNEMLRPVFYEKTWKGSISKSKLKVVSTISGGIYKGMETVLKTASLLKQYGGLDFEWHIVGYDVSTKWVHICEKMTGVNAADCNILFHGRIDAGLLSDLLCESDIYAHVSHIENSPNSVCEAMLLGMPVIASYAGGTASLLQDEVEGKLVQDGDPYVLAGAIIDFWQHSEKSTRYAAAARQRALVRHDKKRIISELLEGYGNILNDFNSKH